MYRLSHFAGHGFYRKPRRARRKVSETVRGGTQGVAGWRLRVGWRATHWLAAMPSCGPRAQHTHAHTHLVYDCNDVLAVRLLAPVREALHGGGHELRQRAGLEPGREGKDRARRMM